MKKINLFILVAVFSIFLNSCKNGGISMKMSFDTDSIATNETDTLWNDEVQSEFFDTKFGASGDEVVDNFSNYGFILLEDLSDENSLVFGHKSKYYSFSDMHWVNMTVTHTDGLFSSISLFTPRDTKADAMKDFDNIVSNISKKYQLTNVVLDDTTVYALKRAYSKSPYVAGVGCYSYIDDDSVKCYTTSLDFTDTDLYRN